MEPIKVMVNGLPGNVAANVARHVIEDERFCLLPYSLTGPEIVQPDTTVKDTVITLLTPEKRDQTMADIIEKEGPFISVDYTHPTAVNANADFYCKMNLPFVMGTTGGDRDKLVESVRRSAIAAVIAPNMAKPIVGLQAMMAYAAENFPDVFKDFDLEVVESHQAGKADTSGTAKDIVAYFNKMGVDFRTDEIKKERDPAVQKDKWGIPEAHLKGHAWHTYTLTSQDDSVKLAFTHNINGRDVYARGTLDAVGFLHEKLKGGGNLKGVVFSMIDVLKGT